jgi:hypothetical protein
MLDSFHLCGGGMPLNVAGRVTQYFKDLTGYVLKSTLTEALMFQHLSPV